MDPNMQQTMNQMSNSMNNQLGMMNNQWGGMQNPMWDAKFGYESDKYDESNVNDAINEYESYANGNDAKYWNGK